MTGALAHPSEARTRASLDAATFLNRTSTVAVATLGLGALFVRDVPATRVASVVDGTPLDVPADVANVYGDGAVMGGAALAFLALGSLGGRENLHAFGRDLGTSLLAAWTATWALKVGVDAKRPNGGRYSFPSGHTATAFAAAPVVSRHCGRRAGVFAYGIATLTAFARVEDNMHHVSDVFAGAAIGILAGRLDLFGGVLRVTPASPAGIGLSASF